MKKKYVLILFLTSLFFMTQQGFSQNSHTTIQAKQTIKNLTVYPNPISNSTTLLHINTKNSLTKSIEIYNVLGKKVFATMLDGKELNISKLSPGVYMLKITENNIAETRKLIVK